MSKSSSGGANSRNRNTDKKIFEDWLAVYEGQLNRVAQDRTPAEAKLPAGHSFTTDQGSADVPQKKS